MRAHEQLVECDHQRGHRAQQPRAVWTGELMIVWGCAHPVAVSATVPQRTWTPVNGSDPYALRSDHAAIWTGTEMIAWGGSDTPFGTFYGSGNIYTPATASWRDTNLTGAPQGRYFHTAVWTGTEMIVWWTGRPSTSGPAATTVRSPIAGGHAHTRGAGCARKPYSRLDWPRDDRVGRQRHDSLLEDRRRLRHRLKAMANPARHRRAGRPLPPHGQSGQATR